MSIALAAFVRSPGAAVLALGVWWGMYAWADWRELWKRIVAGTIHFAAHMTLFIVGSWLAIQFCRTTTGRADWAFWNIALFTLVVIVGGGFVGSTLVGLYLCVADLLRGHANDVFVCQSDFRFKEFLRFKLDRTGRLSLYVVAIDEPCTEWTDVNNPAAGLAKIEPRRGSIVERAKLFEGPIDLGLAGGLDPPPASGR